VFRSTDQPVPITAAVGNAVGDVVQVSLVRGMRQGGMYLSPKAMEQLCPDPLTAGWPCIMAALGVAKRYIACVLQAKPAQAASRWQRRYTIVALCFVAFMLCNMDRVNMSIAILPMAKQYAWDSQTIGLVQSSFFWCVVMDVPVRKLLHFAPN
jgi:hypothetical protein